MISFNSFAAAGVLASAALFAACTSAPSYTCTSNAQCLDGSNVQGNCEAAGFCSFPDSTCSDSGERYDSSADFGLASTCVPVLADPCVSQIAVGIEFSCFLRSDGTVWCWGNNADGEIGDGTTDQRNVPTKVVGLPDASSLPAVSVSTAEEHACALLKDGEVWCWGINDTLNLGQCNGASLTNSLRPLQVPTWTPGTPPTCNAAVPFKAALPSGRVVSTLTTGGEHSCAIGAADGELYCWGENTTGSEGGEAGQDFSMFPNVPGPLIVSGTKASAFTGNVLDVQSGDDFTCLARADNSAWCWGGNQLGELANGGTAASITPVAINGLSDTQQLIVDDETACVLTTHGDVSCWGNGQTGLFGPVGDMSDNETSPMQVATGTGLYGGPSAETLCLSSSDESLQCWGDNGPGEAGIGTLVPVNVDTPTPALLASVKQLRIGQYHACALTEDGSLWCWGDNTLGELGTNGDSTPVPTRVPVTCP